MPETSQTLDRGLQALQLIASSTGLTVSELARSLHIGRTVAQRLVVTLEQHDVVVRDSTGRYHAGLGLLPLAQGVQPLLRNTALPVLRGLAEAVGATAHLTIADGVEALAVAVVEPSWTEYHVAYRVGSRHPLSRGAGGRAILLGRAEASSGAYVASSGELQPGAEGIAAPLRGVRGLDASVGVIALGGLDVPAVAGHVVRAARELSSRLVKQSAG